MSPADAPTLNEPTANLPSASHRLEHWGFLADPDLPDRPGPASLIVALRERPTLRHYDPEVVEYWSSEGGRGNHQTITRETRAPFSVGVSWGEIRILDRLGESNGYFSFGGRVEAQVIGGDLIVAFTSSAPILRVGGHSQGWDEGADSVGAFFGRLLLTVDYLPGFEERLAAATPVARYAAFIQNEQSQGRAMRRMSMDERPFAATIRCEAARLRQEEPEAWSVGTRLVTDLGRT